MANEKIKSIQDRLVEIEVAKYKKQVELAAGAFIAALHYGDWNRAGWVEVKELKLGNQGQYSVDVETAVRKIMDAVQQEAVPHLTNAAVLDFLRRVDSLSAEVEDLRTITQDGGIH